MFISPLYNEKALLAAPQDKFACTSANNAFSARRAGEPQGIHPDPILAN